MLAGRPVRRAISKIVSSLRVTLLDQFPVVGRKLFHAARQGRAAGLQNALAGRPLVGQRLQQSVVEAEPVAAAGLANFNTSKYATRQAQA